MEPPPAKRRRVPDQPLNKAAPPPPPPREAVPGEELSPAALAELLTSHLGNVLQEPDRSQAAEVAASPPESVPWRPPQLASPPAESAPTAMPADAAAVPRAAGLPPAAASTGSNQRALHLLHSLRRVLWKATELIYDLDATLRSLSQELNPDAPSSRSDPFS